MRNIAIIGGGPAGLFAAWCAARVLTEEASPVRENDRWGENSSRTGSGQCNLTREDPAEQIAHPLRGAWPLSSSTRCMPLIPSTRSSVPKARTSARCPGGWQDISCIIESLRCARRACPLMFFGANVRIVTGSRILTMEKRDGRFFCDASERTFAADRVLLATGGMTYPKTGSTGWVSPRIPTGPCHQCPTSCVDRGERARQRDRKLQRHLTRIGRIGPHGP